METCSAPTRYSGRSFSFGIHRASTGIMTIVIAMAAVMTNCRGRKNHEPAADFTATGAETAAAVVFDAVFVDFFLPVAEPFAMGIQIRSES